MAAGIPLKYVARDVYDLVAQDRTTSWRFYLNV